MAGTKGKRLEDLERREPELMAHVQALTDGQLQKLAEAA
jgi:hypothetical protein